MSFIKIENNVPETYCNRSRDFQLLCRLFTCVVNDTKFNIDTMLELVNSHLCRADMLQLLQTKLGFFSDKHITDEELRLVLEAFPVIVKNKGSLKSIKQAINVFLKCKKINTSVQVIYTTKETTIQGVNVDAHSLVIGIESYLQDITILKEIFRYILPVGIGYYFYFYSSSQLDLNLVFKDSVKLFVISNNVNSVLRTGAVGFDYNSQELYPSNNFSSVVNGIDTIQVISSDSKFQLFDNFTVAFIGKFESTSDINSPVEGSIALIKQNDTYYEQIYLNSEWKLLNFRGNYSSVDTVTSPIEFDVIAVPVQKYIKYDNGQFKDIDVYIERPINPKQGDIYHDVLTDDYYIYLTEWQLIDFNGSYYSVESIPVPVNGIYYLNGTSYYIYQDGWKDCTYGIYQLHYYEGEL